MLAEIGKSGQEVATAYAVVLCTAPVGESRNIAQALVEERLVACVNIHDVSSYFVWKGEMQSEKEALLIMKTRADKVGQVVERIRELHSYEVPEIIALPIIAGHKEYLEWVGESVGRHDVPCQSWKMLP